MIALVNGSRIPIRLVSSNPTGYNLRVDFYVEHRDMVNKAPILKSVAGAWWPTVAHACSEVL